jgi:hypothetical protein
LRLILLALLIALSFLLSQPITQSRISLAQTDKAAVGNRLSRLESFLVDQFNATVGLVRESPNGSIAQDYWLLSDNLIAMHVLSQHHLDIAAKINETLHKYGVLTDGLHEALFGGIIQLPPYTPVTKVVANNSFLVQVEVRGNESGKLQPDWTEYADLLIYGALSAHNAGDDQLAIYYFSRAVNMWNGAGLWDLPTQQDGFYATYKLALLMYAADTLNQTIPYRAELEGRIWQFQREDGGIRAFYLGNMTSNREANSETAGLVLLAYQYKIQKDAALAAALAAAEAKEQFLREATFVGLAVFAAISVIVILVTRTRRMGKNRSPSPTKQIASS